MNYLHVAVDIIVVLNAVLVGLEVEMPELLGSLHDVFPILFCVIYIGEFVLNFAQGTVFKSKLLMAELVVVLVAVMGAFALPGKKVLWRASVFRIIRGLRILPYASTSHAFADLWLALAAMRKGALALAWLILILFLGLIVFGIGTRGLVYAGVDDDLTTAVCGGDDFRKHLMCINVDEYFGSVYRSTVTMLQMATLDRWAAHVVRPLSIMRPEAAMFIVCFVFVTTYGLLSIAVGVLVWCTVEVAKLHDTHRDRISVVQDRNSLHELRDYLGKCLALEARTKLDFREIKEAMMLPSVKKVYDELKLPVTDLKQLWTHLDPFSTGEVTLDEFEHGCISLLEPAGRLDMAHLSARLNGRGAFAKNLGDRCDATIDDLDHICGRLTVGFAKLRRHVLSEDINETFAEVGLRRLGKMKIPPPIEM